MQGFFCVIYGLNCFDICIPGTVNAVLHGLIGRTQVCVDLKSPFRLLQEIPGSLELIVYAYLRNSQNTVNSLHVTFDLGRQVFSC
jgi:hypothetical protein